MKLIKNICLVLIAFMANQTIAANVQTTVNFNNPEKFTDFKSQVNSQVKDRKKLMDELQKLIVAASNKVLPNDSKLEISINNIDMAGRINQGFIDNYRVINETDRIKLEFSYRMLNIDGKTIQEDNVILTTRNPMALRNKSNNYKHTHFTYEMPLYNRWLRKLIQ